MQKLLHRLYHWLQEPSPETPPSPPPTTTRGYVTRYGRAVKTPVKLKD